VLLGQGCTRSKAVRLSAALRALDRRKCARAHVTALKTHGVAGEAMASREMRALRADEACARLCHLGSSALARARYSLFAIFHHFNRSLNARTCNTIKH
jgi:hypothetical protein